jgi:hypothetical protein
MRQCCFDASLAGPASPRGPPARRCSALRRPCPRRASLSRVRSSGDAEDTAAAVDEALASVVQAVKDAGSLGGGGQDEDSPAPELLELLPLAVDLDTEVQKRRCFAIIAVRVTKEWATPWFLAGRSHCPFPFLHRD